MTDVLFREINVDSCPFAIFDVTHYSDAGYCRCADPIERARMIAEWGYTDAAFNSEIVRCNDCLSASRLSEWQNKCSNPACYRGLSAWQDAEREWRRAREDYVAFASSTRGENWNISALREIYEQSFPAPKRTEFELEGCQEFHVR